MQYYLLIAAVLIPQLAFCGRILDLNSGIKCVGEIPLPLVDVASVQNGNEMTGENEDEGRYAETVDELAAVLTDKGFVTNKVYCKESDEYPKYWYEDRVVGPIDVRGTKVYLNKGKEIEESMRIPTFTWNYSASDIVDSFNSGSLFTLYRGHGNAEGWVKPLFKKGNIEQITDGTFSSIIFSIACSTGRYNWAEDSFAESLIKKTNNGPVAVIAAVSDTDTEINNQFAFGLLKSVWSGSFNSKIDMSLNPNSVCDRTMGGILLNGLAQVRYANAGGNQYKVSTFQKMYHIFGDPSMKFYSEPPRIVVPEVGVVTFIDSIRYTFRVPITNKASVYNHATGKHLVFKYGGSVSIRRGERLSICFTGENVRPAIWSNQNIRPMRNNVGCSNHIVREGWIWRKAIKNKEQYRLEWFEGTTEINGKEYANLHMMTISSIDSVPLSDDYVIAYMREEGDKVYSITNRPVVEILGSDSFGSAFIYSEDDQWKEYLVYDFSVAPGDMLYTFEGSPSNMFEEGYQNFYIVDTCNVESMGNVYSGYIVRDDYGWERPVLDKVGFYSGTLCFAGMVTRFDSEKGRISRTEVFDENGSKIFDSKSLTLMSVFDYDSDEEDVEYFNLQGLSVSHPIPGQTYIERKGNKVRKVRY